MLAGAGALLSKALAARDLFEAIRRVNRGERLLEPLSSASLREASSRLPEADRALVGMLIDGAGEREVARTLRMEPRDVRHAVQRTLSTLRLEVPAVNAG